ncbi:nucleotidyltransferase family protein [Paenibacillus terreus]|uniref:Nucleotidyltransferase family protein n=1 Tax=Paenibacillus terreus TaxID=1387834 RepID=A0ABV5B7H8_9BACL
MEEGSDKQGPLKKHMLTRRSTIREALETIERTGEEIALIGEEGKLYGIVTDSDVRKGMLKGATMQDPVDRIVNKSYIYAFNDEPKEWVWQRMTELHIRQMPIINRRREIVDLLLMNRRTPSPEMSTIPVLIMAGGLGTRLRPLTDQTPKPMVHVGGKPLLHTLIERLQLEGFREMILSIHYRKEEIQQYFGAGEAYGVHIHYVDEQKRMGTAGAIRLASQLLQQPFLVINGDIMTKLNFRRFMSFHLQQQASLTIASVPYEFRVPYGVIESNEARVKYITEKPLYQFLVSAGMYCVNPGLIHYIPDNEYFDMTQLIEAALANSEPVVHFPIHEYWLDIGRMPDYEKANEDYKLIFEKYDSQRCADDDRG